MPGHYLGDTAALTGRSLRHILRSPDTVITTVAMPVAMMLLFVYVLGGAIIAGPGDYVNYLLPGILVITVVSSITYTAVRVFADQSTGIAERFRSMPIARSSALWAHVVTSLVATTAALVIVLLIAVAMGYRSPAATIDWFVAAGLVLLLTLALTWVAVIPGLSAKSPDGAAAFSYPLIFLPFLSSAFVPTATMPAPVRAFANHQPVTPVVNAIRDLLAGRPADTDLVIALVWCAGILVVADVAAMLVYRRTAS